MLSLWSPKPQSLSSQSYCTASNPSSCICGLHFIFCGLSLFLMFRIIKVIYAHCGKFTMSIKLQRAGKEQVTNQHEWFESTCIKRFYTFIKRGRDGQEQKTEGKGPLLHHADIRTSQRKITLRVGSRREISVTWPQVFRIVQIS